LKPSAEWIEMEQTWSLARLASTMFTISAQYLLRRPLGLTIGRKEPEHNGAAGIMVERNEKAMLTFFKQRVRWALAV
jgi:hypothetical protein